MYHLIEIYIGKERQATGLWAVSVKDDHAGYKYGINIFCSCAVCSVFFCLEEEVNSREK